MILPLRTPNRPRKVRLVSFPPIGRRKLHPLPCSSSPLVATSSISFASAFGESSSIPLRLLSPQKRCFCGGPSDPLRWAFAGAPLRGRQLGCADSFPARKLSGVGASPGAAGLVPLNCQTVHPIGAPGRGIALEGPRPPGLVPADGFYFFASGGDALRWGSFSHARKGTKSAPGARRGLACAPKGGAGPKGSAPRSPR